MAKANNATAVTNNKDKKEKAKAAPKEVPKIAPKAISKEQVKKP